MALKSFQRLTFTGLSLFIVSALTAAFLPKNEDKKANNGRLVPTSDGGGNNTCQNQSGFNQCTYTATLAQGVDANRAIGSRTSTNNSAGQNDSSSITLTGIFGVSIKSLTEGSLNFPRTDLHTSFDNM